jgi:hypothetical protein
MALLDEIEYHATQSAKIRAKLGRGFTPWQLIPRPKGMKTRQFKPLIRRLRYHDKEFKRKFLLFTGGGTKKLKIDTLRTHYQSENRNLSP